MMAKKWLLFRKSSQLSHCKGRWLRTRQDCDLSPAFLKRIHMEIHNGTVIAQEG
jgi:hypothetical protein